MKAILEFDAPKSCAACQMSYIWKRRYGDGEERNVRKCAFANTTCQAHETDRAPFCPLKIVPDVGCVGKATPAKVMAETHDDNGVEYEFIHYRCPGCANIITQERRGQKEGLYRPAYHQDCGQRLDWGEEGRRWETASSGDS